MQKHKFFKGFSKKIRSVALMIKKLFTIFDFFGTPTSRFTVIHPTPCITKLVHNYGVRKVKKFEVSSTV